MRLGENTNLANFALFFVFLMLAGAVPSQVSAYQGKPPLVINFIVDPKIQERAGGDQDLRQIVQDITSRASLIFNFEIGRPLAVGTIEIGTPIKNYDKVAKPEELLLWLKNRDTGKGRFLVFLSEAPFFDYNHDRFLGGDSSDGRLIILEYVFETQRVAFVLLHEIGDLCGAKHSKNITSIMAAVTNRGISYEDAITVIRENCAKN